VAEELEEDALPEEQEAQPPVEPAEAQGVVPVAVLLGA